MEILRLRGILLLAIPWLVMYLADRALRWSWLGPAYVALLERLSISVSAGQVQWYTTRVNRVFVFFGRQYPRAIAVWFAAGAVVGVLAMVASVATLCYTVVSQVLYSPDQQVLTAVIPGVNLPMTEAGYYFFALVVAGVLHEVGHGIAAVAEHVQVHGFGVFIIGVYPGAFVDLNSDQLAALSPARQLRVYCAGVWHNFVLSVACVALLAAMPALVWPLYMPTAAGATIQYITPSSAVTGSINTGALVTGINECPVTSAATWGTCLQSILHQDLGTNPGFCTPATYVAEVPQAIYICCDHGLDQATLPEEVARTALCFVHDSPAYRNAGVFGGLDPDTANDQRGPRRLCLPARQVVAHPPCEDDTDCGESTSPASAADDGNASDDNGDDRGFMPERICLRPASSDLAERLIRIRVAGQPTVLYVGHPANLLSTVAVQDLRPRLSWLPVYLPLVLERLLRYTFSLSSALYLLNMVPAYYLDGQWATIALIDLLVPAWPGQRKAAVARTILGAGSVLFIVSILVSLWTAFR